MKYRGSVSFILIVILLIFIFLVPLLGLEITEDKKVPVKCGMHFIMDTGLGNLSSLYFTYGEKQFSIGLGCGYLYYTDQDSRNSIHALSPNLIISTTVGDLVVLRERVGYDFIAKKGDKFRIMGYVFSSDFLLKILRLKESCFCGGVSLPVLIGEESVDMDTTIGISYMVDL